MQAELRRTSGDRTPIYTKFVLTILSCSDRIVACQRGGCCTCLLNMPCQKFLNCCLKAEKATTAFVDAASAVSVRSMCGSGEFQAVMKTAKDCNLSIISGRRGREAVQQCHSVFSSYSSGLWSDLAMSRPDKFNLACGMIELMGEAYLRLQFYYEAQPKFSIFQAVATDDYNLQVITDTCRPIELAEQQCTQCVDRFSSVWPH